MNLVGTLTALSRVSGADTVSRAFDVLPALSIITIASLILGRGGVFSGQVVIGGTPCFRGAFTHLFPDGHIGCQPSLGLPPIRHS